MVRFLWLSSLFGLTNFSAYLWRWYNERTQRSPGYPFQNRSFLRRSSLKFSMPISPASVAQDQIQYHLLFFWLEGCILTIVGVSHAMYSVAYLRFGNSEFVFSRLLRRSIFHSSNSPRLKLLSSFEHCSSSHVRPVGTSSSHVELVAILL